MTVSRRPVGALAELQASLALSERLCINLEAALPVVRVEDIEGGTPAEVVWRREWQLYLES